MYGLFHVKQKMTDGFHVKHQFPVPVLSDWETE